MESRRSFFSAAFWLGCGIVLFAVGAKLALIDRYGTDQPYADQWAAEGMYMLRGPLYYDVDFQQMISTHSEHRPALSRYWLRGLIAVNGGQWDPFAQLVANLLIYAVFLGVAWRWLTGLVEGWWRTALALVMMGLFALPCAYENFLWGFQSCFLFMLLTSLTHIILTLQATKSVIRWLVAQCIGLAGLFSIASGVMSAAALVVLSVMALLSDRRQVWAWATLAANALFVALGLWLLPTGLVSHGGGSTDPWAVLAGLGYLLSWPGTELQWCLLLQGPCLALLLRSFRDHKDGGAGQDRQVVGLGLCMVMASFSIAYGRHVLPDTIGVRYYDVLLTGLFVNAVALARLGLRLRGLSRVSWAVMAVGWLVVVGLGLWRHNRPDALKNLFEYQHNLAVEQRQIVRDFLVTSDPAQLRKYADTTGRFPHFDTTLVFLRDPKVPALLPPSLTPDGHAGPLSRLARQVAAGWSLLLGGGVVLLLWGTFRSRREGLPGRQS